MHPCYFSPASWLQVEISRVPHSSSDVVCPAREPCTLRWGHHLPSLTSMSRHFSLSTLSCNQHEHTGLFAPAGFTPLAPPWNQHISKPLTDLPCGQPPHATLRLGTSCSARQGDKGKLYFIHERVEPESRFMVLHYSKKETDSVSTKDRPYSPFPQWVWCHALFSGALQGSHHSGSG